MHEKLWVLLAFLAFCVFFYLRIRRVFKNITIQMAKEAAESQVSEKEEPVKETELMTKEAQPTIQDK